MALHEALKEPIQEAIQDAKDPPPSLQSVDIFAEYDEQHAIATEKVRTFYVYASW